MPRMFAPTSAPTMPHPPATRANLMTPAEAAAYLGISHRTIRHWVYERKIPHVKLRGVSLRFRVEDLDAIIRQGEVEPVNPTPKPTRLRRPTVY